jgi:hypothetical protein
MKSQKIAAGLYEVTDSQGTKWIIEHVTKNKGFASDEWHIGTEGDPHADQYNTKRECLEALRRNEGSRT